MDFENDSKLGQFETNIQNYLKKTNKRGMAWHSCRQLSDSHLSLSNYVEAAKSLLLLTEGLPWSDDTVESVENFSAETATARKERVYKHAIDYYKKGKFWEKAIGLLKELEKHYRDDFQFERLAEVLVCSYFNSC